MLDTLEQDPSASPAASPPPSDPTPVVTPPAGGGSEPSSGQPSVVSSQPAAPSVVMERLRSAGLDPGAFTDEGQAVDYLLQSIHNYPQLEQMAQYGNLYLQHQNEFQQYLQSRNQPGPQAPHQAPEKPKWQPKEYDPRWEQLLKRNEAGDLVPVASGIDPTLPQKYLDYKIWEREQSANLLKDPRAWIKQHIAEDLEEVQTKAYEKAMQDFQAALAAEQQRAQGNQLLQQHADVLYQRNGQGQVLRDARGYPLLSEQGHAYANAVNWAVSNGVTNPAAQHQVGLLAIAPQKPPVNVNGNGHPQPDPNQTRRDRFANAGHAPQANGTALNHALDPTHTQNEGLSFLQMAEQTMRARGQESLIPNRN